MNNTISSVSLMMKRWDNILDAARAGNDKLGYFKTSLYEEMLCLTIDVLGKTAFSYDFRSVSAPTPEEAPLYTAFKKYFETDVETWTAVSVFSNKWSLVFFLTMMSCCLEMLWPS